MQPEEVWWHPDREQWEDLCYPCRLIVIESMYDFHDEGYGYKPVVESLADEREL